MKISHKCTTTYRPAISHVRCEWPFRWLLLMRCWSGHRGLVYAYCGTADGINRTIHKWRRHVEHVGLVKRLVGSDSCADIRRLTVHHVCRPVRRWPAETGGACGGFAGHCDVRRRRWTTRVCCCCIVGGPTGRPASIQHDRLHYVHHRRSTDHLIAPLKSGELCNHETRFQPTPPTSVSLRQHGNTSTG